MRFPPPESGYHPHDKEIFDAVLLVFLFCIIIGLLFYSPQGCN